MVLVVILLHYIISFLGSLLRKRVQQKAGVKKLIFMHIFVVYMLVGFVAYFNLFSYMADCFMQDPNFLNFVPLFSIGYSVCLLIEKIAKSSPGYKGGKRESCKKCIAQAFRNGGLGLC